jgi:hypothetical protein
MEEEIVECTPTIPFSKTSSVDMARFVDPHKIVVQRNAFSILGNVQNEGVSKVKIESFGHGSLKHSFSQVEGDLDLQEILKLAPLPKKIVIKKKVTIITMKEEDEEGEKVEKAGKIWGMMKFYISLHYEEKWLICQKCKKTR